MVPFFTFFYSCLTLCLSLSHAHLSVSMSPTHASVGLKVIGLSWPKPQAVDPRLQPTPSPDPPSQHSPNVDKPGFLWISWVSSSIQALGFSGFHCWIRHCLPQPIALVFRWSKLWSFFFFFLRCVNLIDVVWVWFDWAFFIIKKIWVFFLVCFRLI